MPNNNWVSAIAFYGNRLLATYDTPGVMSYWKSANGTLSYSQTWDLGQYHRGGLWTDDGQMYYMNYGAATNSGSIVTWFLSPLNSVALYANRALTSNNCGTYQFDQSGLDGNDEWIFVCRGDYIHSLRRLTAYHRPSGTETFYFDHTSVFDSLLARSELSVDVDGDWSTHGHHLGAYDGAAYTYADAGSDWSISSSRALKDVGLDMDAGAGARALTALAGVPIKRWRYDRGKVRAPEAAAREHVGPLAEDWHRVVRVLRPGDTDSLTIHNEDRWAAVLLIVQELGRRNGALESEVADLRQRLQAVEATTTWEDK